MEQRICIPKGEFAERVKKAQALMKEQGVDLMFAFANEAEPQFVRYLCDYWPSFETAAVVFGQEGDPILLIGPETLTYAKDRSKIPDIRQVKCLRESSNPEYPGYHLDLLEDAIESVSGSGISVAAIAGFNLIPKIVYDELERALERFGKVKVVRGDDLLMSLRMIKSPAELACLKKAAEISATAMKFVIENVRPGMTEQQIRGLGLQSIYENGAESEAYPFWTSVNEGSDQAISRPRAKVLGANDYLYIGIGARYEGYASSVCRSVFFGKPVPWLVDAIKAVYEAQEAVMAELYDGNNAGNVAKAYYTSLGKTGHDKLLLYGPCHACGLMEGEPPWIESDSDYLLKENMYFCVDGFLGKDGYGLRVEDSVRVGKTCGENFSNFPREIFCK